MADQIGKATPGKKRRVDITEQQARFYAETLDKMEANLCGMQHQLFRIRQALQGIVGEPVGFQYDDDTPEIRKVEGLTP